MLLPVLRARLFLAALRDGRKEIGAPVTSSLGTAWSAVSDERHAPTTSLGLTWSNEEPMMVDDQAALYNDKSAARRSQIPRRRLSEGRRPDTLHVVQGVKMAS